PPRSCSSTAGGARRPRPSGWPCRPRRAARSSRSTSVRMRGRISPSKESMARSSPWSGSTIGSEPMRTSLHTKSLAFALALGALALAHGAVAEAQAKAEEKIEAEVLVVLAKEEPGEVDPALRSLPALSRPPFNAFKSMKLLSKPKLELTPGEDSEITLPNGRKLRIQVVQILPNGRYRVKVSINRPNERDYLPLLHVVASENDPFFVAGQAYQGGTLVIGVRLSKPAE